MTDPATPLTPWAAAFAGNGYLKVDGILSAAEVARARAHLDRRWQDGSLTVETTQGTPIASIYGDPLLDGLMETIRPRMEHATGLMLHATYSYARIYRRGDRLPVHRDRAACEVSVSINLSQAPDEPWPLNVRDRQGNPAGAALRPGDALIYRGIELWHWREPYEGDACFQVFMHYVDQNGRHAGQKWDGRAALGTPRVR